MVVDIPHPDTANHGDYRELIKFEIDARTFGSDWSHCGLVSSHLAALVSVKREDPLYYANLLSSVLNELFELVFRRHGADGRVACTILHAGHVDRIMVQIPCDAEIRAFFEEAVDLASAGDVGERYVSCLLDEGSFDPRVGLFELAVDYEARLALETVSADAIRLVADMVLDEAGP